MIIDDGEPPELQWIDNPTRKQRVAIEFRQANRSSSQPPAIDNDDNISVSFIFLIFFYRWMLIECVWGLFLELVDRVMPRQVPAIVLRLWKTSELTAPRNQSHVKEVPSSPSNHRWIFICFIFWFDSVAFAICWDFFKIYLHIISRIFLDIYFLILGGFHRHLLEFARTVLGFLGLLARFFRDSFRISEEEGINLARWIIQPRDRISRGVISCTARSIETPQSINFNSLTWIRLN